VIGPNLMITVRLKIFVCILDQITVTNLNYHKLIYFNSDTIMEITKKC